MTMLDSFRDRYRQSRRLSLLRYTGVIVMMLAFFCLPFGDTAWRVEQWLED